MVVRSGNSARNIGILAALILVPLSALLLVPARAEDGPAPAPAAKKPAEKVAPSIPKAPDLLAKMIPSDAIGVVYARNIEAMLSKVRDLVSRIDEQMATEITVADMFQGSGVPADQVDGSRPFALALSLMENGKPTPTFIVPCRDSNAAKTQMGERAPVLAVGDYLALGQAGQPTLAEKRSPLVHDLPGADVVVRVDMVRVMEQLGDQINGGLDDLSSGGAFGPGGGPMGGMPPQVQDMMGGLVDGIKEFLQSSERIDITASIEGGEVQLAGHLLVKAGSSLVSKSDDKSANLLAMGSFLPAGAPLNGLMNLDTSAFAKFMQKFLDLAVENMPEDQRADAKKYFDESMSIMEQIGPGYAFSLSMPKSGMSITQVCDAKDPAAYITRMKSLLASEHMKKSGGMTLKTSSTIPVAGIEVHKFDLAFDAKAMAATSGNNVAAADMEEMMSKVMQAIFGSDQITTYVAAVENKLIMHMGKDVAAISGIIESMSKGARGTTPPRLAQAIRRTGGNPVFLMDMELRTLAQQFIAAISAAAPESTDLSMPTIPDGDAIRALIFATSKGRNHRGALHIDAASLIDMITDMQQPPGPRNK